MIKKLLFIPALAIGVIAFVLLSRAARGPEKIPEQEAARRVRVITAPKLDVVPRAIGYGVVRPGRVWQAVPEVGGRIIEKAPRLKEGNIIKAGTVLLRIDRADYDLEVARAKAQIGSIQAQIEQLAAKEKTLRASTKIEEDSLALARTELARVKKLVTNGSLAAGELDKEKRNVLLQQARLQELQNALSLIEPDRKVLRVQETVERTRLSKAQLSVERTVIRAPFACRISGVDVEQDQVVQKGQQLCSADSIATSEVTAQFPMVGVQQVFPAGDAPIDATKGIEALLRMGLTAVVRLRTGDRSVEWEGSVTRVEGIDSQTRTLGVVVSVAGSYENVRPGTRPPLVRGFYVEVELRGRSRPGVVVVPRSAVHSGQVYVIDAQSRLERRPVEIAFVQSTLAALRSGLDGSESVVVSDLYPAVAGALLDPERDEATERALIADAKGETEVR
ncbi:MAG: efflux RND transporter periplasmic adaptor subunit [Planctomycetota bacterium]|jgi:multidrug resistance efflux pump